MSKKIVKLLLVMVTVFSAVIFSPNKSEAYSSGYQKPTILAEDVIMSGLVFNPHTGKNQFIQFETFNTENIRYYDVEMYDGSSVYNLMGMASIYIHDPRELTDEKVDFVYDYDGDLYTARLSGGKLKLEHYKTLAIRLLSMDYLDRDMIVAVDGYHLFAYNLDNNQAQVIDLEGEFIEPIYVVRKYKSAYPAVYYVLTRAAEIYEVTVDWDPQTNEYVMLDCDLVYSHRYLNNLDDGASIVYDGIWVYTITNYVYSDDGWEVLGYCPSTGEFREFGHVIPDVQGHRIRGVCLFGKVNGVGNEEHSWVYSSQTWSYNENIKEWRCYVFYKCSDCNYEIVLNLAVRKSRPRLSLTTTYTAEVYAADAPDGIYRVFEKKVKPDIVPVPLPEPKPIKIGETKELKRK